MPDIAVTNLTATALGLYDVDGSYHVVGALGGAAVLDPDVPSAEIVGIYTDSGAGTAAEAVAPENTEAPVAAGTPEVDEVVTVDPGEWIGTPPPVLTYQWQISDGEGWEDIEDETGSSLTLTEAMIGEDVRCVVTGTNALDDDTANSNALGPVTDGE